MLSFTARHTTANNIYSCASRCTGDFISRVIYHMRRRRRKSQSVRSSRWKIPRSPIFRHWGISLVRASRKNSTPIDIPCHVRVGRWYGGCIESAKPRDAAALGVKRGTSFRHGAWIYSRALYGCNVNPSQISAYIRGLYPFPPFPRR